MTVTTTNADVLGPLLTRLTGNEEHAPSADSTLDVLWVLPTTPGPTAWTRPDCAARSAPS